mgnify:CR=1 FL=1
MRNMANFLKKSWKYLLLLPIIVVAVVVVFLTLPNGETRALTVTAENIVVEGGGRASLGYEVNIQQALCYFDVVDDTKAVIDESSKTVVGLSAGNTILTVTAKYGNETSVTTVSVVVTNSQETPTDNPGDTEDDLPVDEVDGAIKVVQNGNYVSEIIMTENRPCDISVESEEISRKVSATDGLTVQKITTGIYRLLAERAGLYTLKITTPSYEQTFTVVVS